MSCWILTTGGSGKNRTCAGGLHLIVFCGRVGVSSQHFAPCDYNSLRSVRSLILLFAVAWTLAFKGDQPLDYVVLTTGKATTRCPGNSGGF